MRDEREQKLVRHTKKTHHKTTQKQSTTHTPPASGLRPPPTSSDLLRPPPAAQTHFTIATTHVNIPAAAFETDFIPSGVNDGSR